MRYYFLSYVLFFPCPSVLQIINVVLRTDRRRLPCFQHKMPCGATGNQFRSNWKKQTQQFVGEFGEILQLPSFTIPCLLLFIRLNMIVPPESMAQVCRRRGGDRFEDCYVSLRRDVPAESKPSYVPCSRHAKTRGAAAAAGLTQGPPASPPLVSARPDSRSPRPASSPRSLSPLDVALVGQEVIEDAEARGGLQVAEAHGGGARPTRCATPAATAAGKGYTAPAPALYSAGNPSAALHAAVSLRESEPRGSSSGVDCRSTGRAAGGTPEVRESVEVIEVRLTISARKVCGVTRTL